MSTHGITFWITKVFAVQAHSHLMMHIGSLLVSSVQATKSCKRDVAHGSCSRRPRQPMMLKGACHGLPRVA